MNKSVSESVNTHSVDDLLDKSKSPFVADETNEIPTDVTSKSLAGPSELVMVMPIKQGFVDCLDTRTYKSRLKTVAEVFSSLRAVSRESRLTQPFADVGDRVRAIYSFHIAVLEPDELLLAVAFDRPWEPYIRLVWRHLGAFLDPILCNCEGYVGKHSTDMGFEPFAQWIRKHQINTDTFYHFGNHTVDDILYLDQIEKIYRNSSEPTLADRAAAGQRLRNPLDLAKEQRRSAEAGGTEFYEFIKLGVKAITAFHMLTHIYPKHSKDHEYLLRAARTALTDFPESKTWGESFTRIRGLFNTEIQWFESNEENPATSPEEPAALPRESVQGGILEGYDANHGCLLLLRITDAMQARIFINGFRKQVTSAAGNSPDEHGVYRNIAFTVAGLRHLDISAADIAAFPKEFRDGMEARAGLLGDLRTNHPDRWRLPDKNWPPTADADTNARKVSLDTVDVVIQLRKKVSDPAVSALTPKHPLWSCIEALEKKLQGMQLLSVQVMHSREDKKEHFGFVDGLSQPFVEHKDGRCPRDKVNAGEVFLGYANDRGDPPQHVESTLRRNGTFLVIRSLAQNVKLLEEFAQQQAQRADLGKEWSAEKVMAKMMGRTLEGVPLVATASQTPHNDFDYDKDPTGEQCPLHAHIRRTQPRDGTEKEKVPRIIRRGMSYGSSYSNNDKQQADRGVIFQAYNASIAEQFEVIQRWVSGGNSTGTYSRQSDPLLGVPTQGEDRVLTYPQGQDKPAVRLNLGQRQFVTLNWGCYLFVPSLDALEQMGKCVVSEQEKEAERGETIISRLQDMPNDCPHKSSDAWKQVLEERDSLAKGDDQAVWRAIRENHQGVLRTPFGVLIANAELVEKVLKDPRHFSVSEYDKRLKKCIGKNYLGFDSPEHEQAADKPNSIIAKVTDAKAFAVAHGVGQAALQAVGAINGTLDIPLPKYADLVLSVIAKLWFGIPDGPTIADFAEPAQAAERQQAIADAFVLAGGQPAQGTDGAKTAHCPYHFTSPSRYVFQPNPSLDVEEIASTEGDVLRRKVAGYVDKITHNSDLKFEGELAGELYKKLGNKLDNTAFTSLLMGALLGFMPTVQGNFLSTMREWVRSRELWRIQQTYLDELHKAKQGKSADEAKQAAWPVAKQYLLPSLRRSMAAHPVPAMVHRLATENVKLGCEQIAAKEKLVLGLVSAAADKNHEELWPVFGGDYHTPKGVKKTTHACPAQNMAIGTLLGMISAFLELPGTLRPTPASLVLALQRDREATTPDSGTQADLQALACGPRTRTCP